MVFTVQTSGRVRKQSHTEVNVPLGQLIHESLLPAFEYVPGSHSVGSSVLEEVHLEPAGQVVQVSVAPIEYVPLPQAI